MNYEREYYTMQIPFMVSCNITEYDMSKANISVLLASGLISKEEYDKLYNMPRMERQITIGKMQINNEKIKQGLKNGFAHYRKLFIESNGLQDSDILSIKKDAIFVINKEPRICEFDNYIRFTPKNRYTSFFKILGLEFYYLLDRLNGIENLDVKGISDDKLLLHGDYMVQFLCIVFEALNSRSPEEIIDIIVKFSERYLNRELDLGYYREFNADSGFRVSMKNTQYLMDFALEEEKQYINISYNYKLIQELYKIASLLYSSTKKRR